MGRQFTSVLLIFTYDLSEKTQNVGPKAMSNTAETFVVKETTSPGYFFPGIPLNLMQNILAFKEVFTYNNAHPLEYLFAYPTRGGRLENRNLRALTRAEIKLFHIQLLFREGVRK